MATTDGLTSATTSAILGSGGVLSPTAGSDQSGLIGEGGTVEVGVGVGVGRMSTLGNSPQPIVNRRAGIKRKETIKYFIFILLNVTIIVAHRHNLSKNKGAGYIPSPLLVIYMPQISRAVQAVPSLLLPQDRRNPPVHPTCISHRQPGQSARVRYGQSG